MEVSNAEAEESDGKLLRTRIVVVGSWWFGEDWAKKSHPDEEGKYCHFFIQNPNSSEGHICIYR